ncbi:hypothetical protein CHH61_03610 [Shouchella clausii]|uniref:Uncharacterized protein n=2 Tax=Shouchella clausii TaxID=79880 RepID=A0A268S4E8_SHOCL|nr:hypothetical protein CHH61_03610 [Shouchella clausii]
MGTIENGATIWGYKEARLLREVQKFHSEFVDIIGLHELEQVTGEKFDGADQLPYFGAILTGMGREFIRVVRLKQR